MEIDKKNEDGKRKGLVIAGVIHAVLIVLFFFIGFTKVTPSKAGVEIGFEALGNPNAGGVSASEASYNETDSKDLEKVEESTPDELTPSEEKIITSKESPVVVKKSDKAKTKPKDPVKDAVKKDVQKEKKDPQKNLDPRLKGLGGILNGPDKKGDGKGDGPGKGQQGSPTGSPNGNNGGEGGQYDVGGRKAIKTPHERNDCGVTGKIRVRVKINRAGVVQNDVEIVGGTTQNACLQRIAKKAAKQLKYAPHPNGPSIQEGVVVLNFSIN